MFFTIENTVVATSEIAVFVLTGGIGDDTSTCCGNATRGFGGELTDSDDAVLVGKTVTALWAENFL